MTNIFDAIQENNYDIIKQIIQTNPHSVNFNWSFTKYTTTLCLQDRQTKL